MRGEGKLSCECTLPCLQNCCYSFAFCNSRNDNAGQLTGWVLFQHPITIRCSNSVSSSPVDLAKVSFALLYNLALSHHVWGKDMKSRYRLRKALSFYELACTVQVAAAFEISPLQSMGIANNMGLIYSDLDEDDTAFHYFRLLLDSVISFRRTSHDVDETLDNFVGNALPFLFGELPIQSAPAA